MQFSSTYRGLLAATLLSACSGCSLTATEVEPDLPAGAVNGANTVAYRLNGQPVVAHNYADVVTAAILPFLGPFGSGQPVWAELLPDGTLTMGCVDAQNVSRPGFVQHALTWQLRGFRGTGRYAAVPAATALALQVESRPEQMPLPVTKQELAPAGPAFIEINEWNPATGYVRGTFQLTFAAADKAGPTNVSDGRFSLTLRIK